MAPLGWDTGRWMTSFMSAMTISPVTPPQPSRCCSPHLNPIHWRYQLLVQNRGPPSLFILIPPDYSLSCCSLLQDPPSPTYLQLPRDPGSWCGQNPLSSFSQLLLAFSTGPSLFFSDTHQHAEHTLPGNPQPPHLPKIQRGQKKPRN